MGFFNFLFLLFLLPFSNGADRSGLLCNQDKNLTSSQASTNIDRVLAKLVSNVASNGFAKSSYGQGGDQVYGLIQCRGDVSTEECSACAIDAAKQLRQLCPNQADARIWFEYCFLRYDTRNFVGELDTGYGIFYWNVENATDPEKFEQELGGLLDRVRKQALVPQNRGLGKSETKFSAFVTIYGLVQCTRDLSQLSCAQCLSIAIANSPNFCRYKKGCRVLYSSCYLRYEIYPFFFPVDSTKAQVGSSLRAFVFP